MSFTVGLTSIYRAARDQMVIDKMAEVRALGQGKTARTLDNTQATQLGFTVEAAWAQYNGAPYTFRPYELGGDDVLGYQLRGTHHLDGHLFTYDRDPNAIYIFGTVNDTCDIVTFIGWSTKKRANIPTHLRTYLNNHQLHEPAYCTSQVELWSFDLLPATKQLMQHRSDMVA